MSAAARRVPGVCLQHAVCLCVPFQHCCCCCCCPPTHKTHTSCRIYVLFDAATIIQALVVNRRFLKGHKPNADSQVRLT